MSDSDSGGAAGTEARKRLRKSVAAGSDDESDFGGGEDGSPQRAKEPDSARPSPAGSESEGEAGGDQDGDDDEDLGSDDGEEEVRKDTAKKKRKKKKGDGGASSRKRVRDYVDDMAVDEDEGEDADDDEDEGEDNDYQYDDFVVGDVEDAGEGEAGRQQRRKKKRTRLVKASGGQTLDEEDLALIAENAGMREGGDVGMARLDMPAEAPRRRRAVEADFDSEEDDDFIVDDLGGYGRAAGGMRAPRVAGVEREEYEGGPTQDQVDEAMDIFGEMPPEFSVLAAAAAGGAAAGGGRAEAERRRRAALARMEPAMLREYFITDEDHKVRETDRPERLQNRMKGRGEIIDVERKEEADWIMPQLKFEEPTEEMRAAVEKVLFYYQVERQEVPFVAHHRRDYFEPWLQRRHLWQIFELDEKWERLTKRRDKVEKSVSMILKRMRGETEDEADVVAMAAESTYLSETEGEREERSQKERWAAEDRATRLRRAEENAAAAKEAADMATAAVELGADAANAAAAEAHAAAVAEWEKAFADHEAAATTLEARRRAAEGPVETSIDDEEEAVEEARQTEQKAVASALAALGPPPPRPDEPAEATLASLELAEAEALARLERATVYLQGARGDAELETAEEEREAAARLERARERRDAKMKEYREMREKMLESTKDEAAMVPEDAYKVKLHATMDEQDIKDMQRYLGLVTAPSGPSVGIASSGGASGSGGGAGGSGGGGASGGAAAGGAGCTGERHLRASQKDRESYAVYRRGGLRRYTSQFCVSAHVSGRAIDMGQTVEVPTPTDDPKVLAAEAAEELASQEENPIRVPQPTVSNPDLPQQYMLRAMHHLVALEFAYEPSVRRKCRDLFRRSLVVTTKATERGSSEIDFFHPLYGMHFLKNKPAMDFIYARPGHPDRTSFLQLEKAQREGLLVLKLHLPPRAESAAWHDGAAPRQDQADISPFLKELVPVFNPPGGVTEGVRLGTQKLWEAERAKILEMALLQHLLPQLEAELRAEMRRLARAAVIEDAAAALAKRLAVGPYADPGMSRLDLLTRQKPELKVVGIAVSQEPREPSYAVAIDETGRVTDYLAMPNQRDQLQAKMRQFLLAQRPDLVVVNTSAGQNSRRTGSMLLSTRHTGGGGFGEDVPLQTGLIPDLINEKRHRRSARAARAGDDDSDDEGNGSDDEDEMGEWRCGMVHLRDDVARVFSMSKRGQSEFPDYHRNLRLAVGLARYGQDPLTELAGMWTTMDPSGNFGGEMLFLQLHPLQKEVARPALLRALEQTMMDAVSDVGVDLNDACEHTHQRGLLQFVAGLGPKKAAALRRAVGQGGNAPVVGRQQLLEKKLMGHQVYTNAASFLRFRRRLQREGDDDEHIDGNRNPFDSTRIHPECYTRYEWALKMCGNALEVEIDPDQASELVSSVMNDSYEAVESMLRAKPQWHPDAPGAEELEDKLSELDLTQYAADLEQHGLGKRLSQLELIKAEIRFPYRDRRTPLAPPTEAELFEMLTGESDTTMRPGTLVTCRVTGHVPGGVKVVVEGDAGLFGFVRGEFASDQQQEYGFADWESVVPRRQVREAAIMEVRKDRFELLLSLRQSELDRSPQGWGIKWSRPDTLPPIDTYFDAEAAARAFDKHLQERQSIVQRERERQEAAGARATAMGGGAAAAVAASVLPRRIKGVYVRNIRHPNFQNLTFAQAEEALKGKPAGEALIRPSSKGADRLSISWVWIEGQVKHMEILEMDKAPGALIGSKLVLRDEEYEDIDELMSRYVARCDELVAEIIAHPKYRPDSEPEVEAMLRAEKSRDPNRIPYFICRVPQMPGYFQLMFLGNTTVHKERFEVTPDGFRMGKETLLSAHDVIRRFKEAAAKAASRGSSSRQGSRGGGQQQPPPPPGQPPLPMGPPPGGYGQQQYVPYQTGYQGYGYQQGGWGSQGQQGNGWGAQANGQQGYGNGAYDGYGQQPPPPPGPPPPQRAT